MIVCCFSAAYVLARQAELAGYALPAAAALCSTGSSGAALAECAKRALLTGLSKRLAELQEIAAKVDG